MTLREAARLTATVLIGACVLSGCGARSSEDSETPVSLPATSDACSPIGRADQETPTRGIYRMRADGSELCLLALAGARADNPVWSPDGRFIAFVRSVDGYDNFEVFAIDATGGDERNLSNSSGNDSAPAWLPGYPRLLTFVSDRDRRQDIYRVDLSADNLEVLSVTRGAGPGFDMDWSPDGVHFASGGTGIGIGHVASDRGRTLVHHTMIPGFVGAIWPAWSPDGERIAFEVDRDLNGARDHEVFTIAIDGSELVNLTNHPGEDNAPSWSPDGSRIAFASNRDGDRDIYVMNADGSGVERLTRLPGDETDPSWSPDGRHIVFTTGREWEQH